MKNLHNGKKLFLLLTVLFILPMSSVPLVTAQAKDCNDPNVICDHGNVGQNAKITAGNGSPPVVEFGWILPDEDLRTSGTQVFPKLSEERNDIFACIVVSDPQGRGDIQQVFADVFHPTGTGPILPCVPSANNKCDYTGNPFDRDPAGGLFKYQVHATKLDPTTHRTFIESCKLNAVAAGLITRQQSDEINYNIFSQPNWFMYKVHLPMLYHQPAGKYKVQFRATDTRSGVSGKLQEVFEWVSTVALEIDFSNGLNYGELQPSVFKVIQGDYEMSYRDGKPTVKNEGNERINISIQSTTLVGSTHGKEINDFDVKWDPEERSFGYGLTKFPDGQKVVLKEPLELCQTEKIDFSVHADVGLPADRYSGILEIWTSAA